MTILDDLKVEQAILAEKIKREYAIESFLEVASYATGHFLTISEGNYIRICHILGPDRCRWEYSEMVTSIEEEVRSALSNTEHNYKVGIRFVG